MSDDKSGQIDMFGFKSVSDGMQDSKKRRRRKPLSKVVRRAIKTSVDIAMESPEQISYQHTVLCQTSLPYRNPGQDVREWQRDQGAVSLLVEAGKARNPDTDQWVELGLPFGTKPRLILAHLNAEAIKTGSPVLDMEDSLTALQPL